MSIKEYLDNHNQNSRIFTWTASVERILAKVAKCKEALGTLHYHHLVLDAPDAFSRILGVFLSDLPT